MGLLGDYAEPLQGTANLTTIPRASLRCALGWYADARCLRPSRKLGSVLRKPIIISGEHADHGAALRRSRASGLFSPSSVFCANGAPHTSLGQPPQVVRTP